jgi:hypothetical protein
VQTTRTLVFVALVASALGAAAGGAACYTVALRVTDPTREVMRSEAPGGRHVAFVRESACGEGRCQSLWLGTSSDDAAQVGSLQGRERCEAIAWSPDGYRMGFLVNGYELRVFDSEPRKLVAQINLVEPDGIPSSRIARGITFAPNGRAVTFDDCPRWTSGCRSGLAGIR